MRVRGEYSLRLQILLIALIRIAGSLHHRVSPIGVGDENILVDIVIGQIHAIILCDVLVISCVDLVLRIVGWRKDGEIIDPAVVNSRKVGFGKEIEQRVPSCRADTICRDYIAGKLLRASAIAWIRNVWIKDRHLMSVTGIHHMREIDGPVGIKDDLAKRRRPIQ